MIKDLHEIQASILKKLLFNNRTNFAALNTTGIDNNHFTFHVKALVEQGYIEKNNRKYQLTLLGKKEAGRLDTETLKFERFGVIGVSIGCKRTVKGVTQYLMQQRLKEPFYGWWGNITGKVRFGDTTEETAIRELKEETGLTGKPIHLGIHHTVRGPDRNHIILDHYFYRYLFKKPKGNLISTEEGKNFWMTEKKIDKLESKFHGFNEYLECLKKEKAAPYEEDFIQVDTI
jgi:8-oxo-dGTP pyrophosphatase MutT (NUDIX family)